MMLQCEGQVLHITAYPRGDETGEYFPGGGFYSVVCRIDGTDNEAVFAFERPQWETDRAACVARILKRLKPSLATDPHDSAG